MPLNKTSQISVLASGTSAQTWQPCILTWYDPSLGGINSGTGVANAHSPTASGEPYNASAMTCAAPPQYSFGTMITFKYQGRTVTCRVNDRGGAIQGSHFDLSRGAATRLGIINSGRAAASFAVGGNASSPAGQQSGQTPAPSGGPGTDAGLGSALSVLTDLITLNLSDAAARLALVGVTVIKDVAIGVGDYIIRPGWHWNQRAVMYYQQGILFGPDPYPQMWTAAFWGLGYYLLFTDPNQPGLKPAPVRNSRIARHVRSLQAIPARSSLIKPADVKAKTPRKPKPVVSAVQVAQVGTLSTSRPERVKVRGEIDGRRDFGTDTAGEVAPTAGSERPERYRGKGPTQAQVEANAQNRNADAANRAGNSSPADRGGTSEGPPAASIGQGIVARHRRIPRRGH